VDELDSAEADKRSAFGRHHGEGSCYDRGQAASSVAERRCGNGQHAGTVRGSRGIASVVKPSLVIRQSGIGAHCM